MKILGLVAMLLAACSSKSAPDCAHAVNGAIDRMVAEAKSTMAPAAAANVARIEPQLKAAITAACVEDKWAPEVVTCVDHAASRVELDACDKQLTPEQRKAEHTRDDAILKFAAQPH